MEITHLDPDPEVWGKEEKTEKRHVDRYVTLLTDIQIRTYTNAQHTHRDEAYRRGLTAHDVKRRTYIGNLNPAMPHHDTPGEMLPIYRPPSSLA